LIKRAVPRDLLALARDAVAAEALSAVGRQCRFGDTRDHVIAPGQIWRAAWGDVSVLVLVCDVKDTDIGAIPVTLDPGAEDAQAVVLEPASTVFAIETTFWAGLRTTLPLRVLDEIIDELPADLNEWIRSPKTGWAEANPTNARIGHPPLTAFDSSTTLRAAIEDDLTWLQASPGLPVAANAGTTRTLASVLGKGVNLHALVDGLRHLGLDQPAVMSLLRGKRPVTPDEADVIARITDVDPTLVAEAVQPLPAAFVAEVDHPRWRPTWRERAQRDSSDETSARLKASYEMYALAARQTGNRTPDWPARLAQFRQLQNKPAKP
jgi:hypothetical protein